MFDYGNTLGNGWILKTHYMQMNREMKEQFKKFTPSKSSFMGKLKKTRSVKILSGCGYRKKKDPATSADVLQTLTKDI